MATWDVPKQAGFLSLSAYLKAGFLLLAAFYDKSLTVLERAENAWTVFLFFTLWGEHWKKFNTSENFPLSLIWSNTVFHLQSTVESAIAVSADDNSC